VLVGLGVIQEEMLPIFAIQMFVTPVKILSANWQLVKTRVSILLIAGQSALCAKINNV